MNRLLLFCCLACLGPISLFAQGLAFDWAKTIGGTDEDVGHAIKRDAAGNLYLAGYFKRVVDFDPGPDTLLLSTINAGSASDIFVMKLDPQGNLLWVHSFGGLNARKDEARSLALDSQGNVLVTGSCEGTVDFDPGPGVANQTATGEDIFVLKLTTDGDYAWAHVFDGNFINYARGITTDGNDDVLVGGRFFGTVDFDPGPNSVNLTAVGGDVFILKLDENGNFLWVKQVSGDGSESDLTLDIAVDGNGDVVATGVFDGTADLDPGAGTQLATAPQRDVFVLKLNGQGDFIWAKAMGGPGLVFAEDVELDGAGNIYLSGYYDADFDADPSADTLWLTHSGSFDYFVEKLDANGNLRWAHGFGGGPFDQDLARGLAIDPAANLYITGRFRTNALDFDPGPGVYRLDTDGGSDAFVQKLDSAGNFLAARHIKTSGLSDIGEAVEVDAAENVYLTGAFYGLGDFNPGPDSFLVESQGQGDIYVLKLVPCDHTSASVTELSCGPYTALDGQVFTETGTYTAVIANAVGCDSVISIDLTVNEFSLLTTVEGATITAEASGFTYQWLNCSQGFAPLAGAIGQAFTASQNGSYAVAITGGPCTDTSACVALTSVGLSPAAFASQLQAYPNPTSGLLNIRLGEVVPALRIEVHSLLGQRLQVHHFTQTDHAQFSLPPTPGCYLLRLTTADNHFTWIKTYQQ